MASSNTAGLYDKQLLPSQVFGGTGVSHELNVVGEVSLMDKKDIEIRFRADSGEIMMLDPKESKLVKLLLGSTLKSKPGRQYISKRLGAKYLVVAERLLKDMEG